MGKIRNRQRNDGRNVNDRKYKAEGHYQHVKPKWEEDRLEKGKAIHIQPKNFNQELMLRSMRENIITVATGSAGVGKSLLMCYYAASELLVGNVRKIVITRPYVATAGRTTGFKPSTDLEKLRSFVLPMIGYLSDILGKGMVEEHLLHNDKIELAPLESIRGRSFDDCIILVDESSNMTITEVQAITTRLGENCRLVLSGDGFQSDTRDNGLKWFETLVKRYKISDIGVVKFTHDDIVRSGMVKELVIAFENDAQGTYK